MFGSANASNGKAPSSLINPEKLSTGTIIITWANHVSVNNQAVDMSVDAPINSNRSSMGAI